MADASWLKKAPPAPALEGDEDPFAELTRIMGFDPRVPFHGSRQSAPDVAASAPQQVTAPHVDLSDEDLDLSIDLERELIGALEPDEGEPPFAGSSQPMQFQQPAEPTQDRDVQSFDEQTYGAAWEEPAAADAAAHSAGDMAAEDDQAYFLSPDDPRAAAPDIRDDQRYATDETGYERANPSEDADYGQSDYVAEQYDERDAAGAGSGYVQASDVDQERDLAAHLDEELLASFENDLADADDDWLNDGDSAYGEDGGAASSGPATYAPSTERSQPDEFARDFDTAMAEVDMDFTAAGGVEQAIDEAAHYAARTELENELDSGSGQQGEVSAGDAPLPHYAADHRRFDAREEESGAFEPAADGDYASAGDVDYESPAADVDYAPSAADGGYAEAAADDEYAAHAFEASEELDAEEGDAYDAETEPAEAQPGEDAAQSEIDDAIAELAAMVRGYDRPQPSAHAFAEPLEAEAPTSSADVPDIETVDIPEDAVALADDLDIPEVDYSDEATPQFDDLDAELAAAFGEPAIETMQPAPVEAKPAAQDFDLEGGYDALATRNATFQAAPYAIAAGVGAAAGHYAQARARDDEFEVVRRPTGQDFDFDDEVAMADDAALQPKPSPRRGLIIASIVGGIAVIGAIGAFVLAGGDGITSGEPALVKADADPVKVKPENPGGTTVPNQQSQVFDRAAGDPAGAPAQDQLISNEEEPVDMATRFPDALPQPIDETGDIDASTEGSVAKDEDRIQQAIAADQEQSAEEATVAVAPRKVRTMIVKSDGTLVPREETAPEPETVGSTTAADSLTDPAISAPPPAAASPELGAAAAPQAAEAPAQEQAPAASAEQHAAAPTQEATTAAPQEPSATPTPQAPRAAQAGIPDSVPVAPSRPADQPLDIVGEVKPDQVAALQPAAGAAAAGSWSMQIASQPSEAAAQSTYRDLSRRYASVLAGRTANIVKAEIAGKGTFWRVRVPAESRNEAIKLCESYKAAGGNCFVSK